MQSEIIQFELQTNDCRINSIIFVSEWVPIYGADSLEWLQSEYDSLYRAKMADLNQQFTDRSKELGNALKEYNTITNPVMKKAYKRGLEGLEYKISQLNHLIGIYTNYPEQTQFGLLSKQINYYEINSGKQLGYWVQISFSGAQGALPVSVYQKQYVFDNNKRLIAQTDRMITYARRE